MDCHFIEASNDFNWGKFMVARFNTEEWSLRSQVDNGRLIGGRGWTYQHMLVHDLQTGEGALFLPGGCAKADLNKQQIWVCPLFEPFLSWLYLQDLTNLKDLPRLVALDAPAEMFGYRRTGPLDKETASEP